MGSAAIEATTSISAVAVGQVEATAVEAIMHD